MWIPDVEPTGNNSKLLKSLALCVSRLDGKFEVGFLKSNLLIFMIFSFVLWLKQTNLSKETN
jgi:hypothetical protein